MSVTSDFYLARAEENARDAREAPLENVRQRHLQAEAAWLAMAERLHVAKEHRAKIASKTQ